MVAVADAQQPDWAEHWDEEAGSYYYFNWKTEEAVWEKPAGFVDVPALAAIEPAAEDYAATAAGSYDAHGGEQSYAAQEQDQGYDYSYQQQEQQQEQQYYEEQQEYYADEQGGF